MVQPAEKSTISSYLLHDGESLGITVSGNFTFEDSYLAFRETYSELENQPEKVLLDFRDVDYMESVILGELLLLKQTLQLEGEQIQISTGYSPAKDVLIAAGFDKNFKLV